ncbi:MAG: DUF1670 domain-containing protein [Candidatus Undinarchaeales archaeon]|jgi:DNA-binding CsgD family transcriptional regulator|nr:DUF1670 domain-containing protein [Candidatus Undinarchaeales archaeon]
MGKVSEAVRLKVEYGLHQAVVNLLNEDYPFVSGSKVQDMFASDIVGVFKKQLKDMEPGMPGQFSWLAASVGDKPYYGQNARNTRCVPVMLTLVSKEDIDALLAGASIYEVRERCIVRFFKDAFDQGGLLTQNDVAAILKISRFTVGNYVRSYMKREGKIVPTRGIIHDLGRSTTHKSIIVRLHLDGYQTPDISKRTDHTIESCDRYIKDYKRVRLLARKGMTLKEIARTLEMSRPLVRDYLKLYEEYENGGINE